MRFKQLMTLALGSTFGLSAGAFAGPGHDKLMLEPSYVILEPSNGSAAMTVVQADDGQQRIVIGASPESMLSSAESAAIASNAFQIRGSGEDSYVVGLPVLTESWTYFVPATGASSSMPATGEYIFIPSEVTTYYFIE